MKTAAQYAALAEESIEQGHGPMATVYANLALAAAQDAMVANARSMSASLERAVAIEDAREARQTPPPTSSAAMSSAGNFTKMEDPYEAGRRARAESDG